MNSIEVVVIGAGVIGLAIARALARSGREVVVLETNDDFGAGVSARNSEVIHAGIYYPKNSLKAKLCVAGRDRLYDFCERFGVEHRRCGKLIVATSQEQIPELYKIRDAAFANRVALQLLDRSQALQMEPQLECEAALYSPLTGIVDSRAYMTALLGQAEEAGAVIAYQTQVTSGIVDISIGIGIGKDKDIRMCVNHESTPSVRARWIVNCAGLQAVAVAQSLHGFPREHIPPAFFAKGNYFKLSQRSPFTRLIYPIPEPGGLGTHLTLDLGGQARFGPDVEWLRCGPDEVNYAVDAKRGDKFYASIRKYWPGLRDGALEPAYSGCRPKISGPSEPAADFRIDGPERHDIRGVINLFGIESPGLTASLAIADEVLARIESCSSAGG